MMFVCSTDRPSQKKVLPKRLQFAKSEVERVWKAFVFPMAMRSALPTSGITDISSEVEIDGKRDEFEKRK